MGWDGGDAVIARAMEKMVRHVSDPTARKEVYSGILRGLSEVDFHEGLECVGIDPAYDANFLVGNSEEFLSTPDDGDDDSYQLGQFQRHGLYPAAKTMEDLRAVNEEMMKVEPVTEDRTAFVTACLQRLKKSQQSPFSRW